MARELRKAAAARSEPAAAPEGLVRMIRAWERGAHEISERYELLYREVMRHARDPEPSPDGAAPHGAGEASALARQVVRHAGELPGPADITAIETAALSRARDGAARAEIRDLAVTAIAQLGQITGKLTRLAELLGGDGGGHG